MEMPRWTRRVLGALALGGGALGFVATLGLLMTTPSLLAKLFVLGFLAAYAFGIVCGIAMLEGHPDALRANTAYWAMQIPAISSYAIGYVLAGGGHLTVYFDWGLQQLTVDFLFGSVFHFNVLQEPETRRAGVNVLALAVVLYLRRCSRRAAAARMVRADPAIA